VPEASAIVVAAAAPLSVTVDPDPPVTGLIVPEMLNVEFVAVAVNVTPDVTFALLIVTFRLAGLNVYPACVGVTVKLPLTKPVNEKFPEASAVTVAFAAPLSVTVAPLPPVTGEIDPEMLNVEFVAVAVNDTPDVTSALLIVTFRLVGLNVYPACDGVTV
jgi:hypothetical protein